MIKVVEDRVAIVPLENPDKIGHIIIPEIAKDRLNQGFVKYVGPQVVDVKVGMYVLFSGYAGSLIHVTNEGKFIVMPENFIVAELSLGEDELKLVPGVYFKSHIERDAQFRELWNIMGEILPGIEDAQMQQIVAGLCKRGVCGPESQPYFTANYELMMEHLAHAFAEDATFRDRIKVVNKRLHEEDYEYMTDKRRRKEEGAPSI